MSDQPKSGEMGQIWSAILATATILGSYALACIFPFAAFGAVAALTLQRRWAVALVAGAWATNQIVGYALLSYPHDASTIGWGLAIGVAAMAGMFAADWAAGRIATPLRAVGALAAAFAVYEGLLFAYAQFAGGLDTFSPAIVGQVATNDASWFAGLMAIRFLLARVSGITALPQTVRG